jgi:hypothetical protein
LLGHANYAPLDALFARGGAEIRLRRPHRPVPRRRPSGSTGRPLRQGLRGHGPGMGAERPPPTAAVARPPPPSAHSVPQSSAAPQAVELPLAVVQSRPRSPAPACSLRPRPAPATLPGHLGRCRDGRWRKEGHRDERWDPPDVERRATSSQCMNGCMQMLPAWPHATFPSHLPPAKRHVLQNRRNKKREYCKL